MNLLSEFNMASKIVETSIEKDIFKMIVISKKDSYDFKNANKLLELFNNSLNINNYGSLKWFVNYINGCRKYYECEDCKKIAKEMVINVNKFLNNYEHLL